MAGKQNAGPRLRQLSLFDLLDTLTYVGQEEQAEKPAEGGPPVKGKLLYCRRMAIPWRRPPKSPTST